MGCRHHVLRTALSLDPGVVSLSCGFLVFCPHSSQFEDSLSASISRKKNFFFCSKITDLSVPFPMSLLRCACYCQRGLSSSVLGFVGTYTCHLLTPSHYLYRMIVQHFLPVLASFPRTSSVSKTLSDLYFEHPQSSKSEKSSVFLRDIFLS